MGGEQHGDFYIKLPKGVDARMQGCKGGEYVGALFLFLAGLLGGILCWPYFLSHFMYHRGVMSALVAKMGACVNRGVRRHMNRTTPRKRKYIKMLSLRYNS